MNRKAARELCMQILYEMVINKEYDLKRLDNYLTEDENPNPQKEYIEAVLGATVENIEKINSVIEEYAIGWSLERIAKVDLAILQLALIEILYIEEVPYNVSINEAVELAKKYGTDESASYINGILGKFVKKSGIKDNE